MQPTLCEVCNTRPWSARLVVDRPVSKKTEIFVCQTCGADIANIKIILPDTVRPLAVR